MTCRCQTHLAGASVKQCKSQLLFQRAHLSTDGRLGDVTFWAAFVKFRCLATLKKYPIFRFSFFHPIRSIFIHFTTHLEYSLISFIYHKNIHSFKNQSYTFLLCLFSLCLRHFSLYLTSILPFAYRYVGFCLSFFFYLSLSLYQQNLFRTFFVVFVIKFLV